MGIVQDTFGQYAGKAFEGQINDLSMADITTTVCATASGIPYGRAVVAAAADKQGILPGAAAALFLGISAMKSVGVSGGYQTGQSTDLGNVVGGYRYNQEVSLLAHGRIWVKTLGGATRGGQAYANANGEITNAAGSGLFPLPETTFLTSAVAGGLALIQVKAIKTITPAA